MSRQLTIQLNNLQFFAFHGLFPEEQKIGNDYLVDISINFPAPNKVVSEIAETVNYATVYEIVKAKMQRPTQLLETITMQLVDDIHERYSFVTSIWIKISKVNPPINQFSGRVSVCFQKEF